MARKVNGLKDPRKLAK